MTNLIAVPVLNTPFIFHFHPTWHAWLTDADLLGTRFIKLMQLLYLEMNVNGEVMWPHHSRWFAAFEDDPKQIRVVILGQDPYPTPHRATGHSFEIDGKADDSLDAIYDAIREQGQYPDARIDYRSGNLSYWRSQGILLLNTALSVCGRRPREITRGGKKIMEDLPRSVYGIWRYFTKGAVRVLCQQSPYLVFVLWGRPAANFHTLKTAPIKGRHDVVMSYHPSDLAKTVMNPVQPPLKLFREVQHFARVNALLTQHHLPPIDWSILPKA